MSNVDSRLKARDQRIKDLDVIINIQEQVIKTQKSNLDIEKKSYNRELEDCERILTRTYKSHGVLVNQITYYREMAEHFSQELGFCLASTKNTMKGKKKNEKSKKVKRKVKSK